VNILNQRIECESEYSKKLENIANQLSSETETETETETGDIEDLISAYKVNLKSRVNNHAQYLEQMKSDLMNT
jgi:hypothetical protein